MARESMGMRVPQRENEGSLPCHPPAAGGSSGPPFWNLLGTLPRRPTRGEEGRGLIERRGRDSNPPPVESRYLAWPGGIGWSTIVFPSLTRVVGNIASRPLLLLHK